MRNLWTYLRAYKKESVLGPLFKLLEASFELIVPLVVAAIINQGVVGGDRGVIVRMGAALVGLALVGLLASVAGQYFAAKAAVGVSTAIRRALFARIQSLPFAGLDKLGIDTLINRMTSDVNQVQTGVNLALRLFLRSPFIVFGAMAMAFTIDVPSALVFAVAIPALSVAVFGVLFASMPLYKKVQAWLDQVLRLTRENLAGVRVIRAFGREADELRAFDAQNQALTRAQQVVGRISALMNPITYLLLNAALIALMHTGAIRVDGGAINQGALVALINYMGQILVELIKLANLIITLTRSLACWGRVEAVLRIEGGPGESAQDTHEAARQGASARDAQDAAGDQAASKLATPERNASPSSLEVAFDRVAIRYPSAGGESLSEVSFTAARGQTIGIIGGTGSGKTTLVNLIPRFYDATAGTVRLGGVDVRDYAPEQLRALVAVVPQKAELFRGTVRDNLRWGDPSAEDAQLVQALQDAQAWSFVQELPGGLDAPVAQRGKNMSGGQRQRLTIARALVRRAPILILDDSASALDYATDAALRGSLRALPGAPTVFIVSQRAASILHADQILVLDDGRVVGQGSHAQLMQGCAVYREIYASQFQDPKEAM